jgi:hypothetical protein
VRQDSVRQPDDGRTRDAAETPRRDISICRNDVLQFLSLGRQVYATRLHKTTPRGSQPCLQTELAEARVVIRASPQGPVIFAF